MYENNEYNKREVFLRIKKIYGILSKREENYVKIRKDN